MALAVGRVALAGTPPPPKPDEVFRATAKALRLAIDDLTSRFGPEYPKGKAFAARLDGLERHAEMATGGEFTRLNAELESLQREAVVANPLVCRQPILFVVRQQYRPDHHNTETMFQTGEINTGSFSSSGGALKTIHLGEGGREEREESRTRTRTRTIREVKTLLEVPKGVARDPELSFDGTRIVFSMRRDVKDDYHIYEIGTDGSGLRQLTFGPALTDIDPLYLPDGRIAFTSTREPKYCMCNRHIMGNLFRMEPDGANMTQIGRSTLHEGHGSLTPDGRILYDRWEYVDRNFGDAQGVWTCNPDGTNHAIYWGNNKTSPGAVLDPRIIPGTELLIATLSSCHDRPWGAIGIIDRRRGLDSRNAVLRTWPASAINLVMAGGYDTFTRVRPRYEDPFPLSDGYFLCSREISDEQMGVFLIDVFGNEVLLHAEAPGCFDPMPVGPRPRLLPIPDRVNLARSEGYFYIHDVYIGTGMGRVPRGTIRFIRVVQSPEKRYWTHPGWDGGTGQQAPGMAWNDFNNKLILGTARVEEDGSAYFAVPADRFVYFQLLDENGMMVQTMRSGTIVRPGEVTGCVGCHENRLASVPNAVRQAMLRPLRPLEPWHGPARPFSYTAEVQPVFDKHCVRCHDFGQPAGAKLNLAGDLTPLFNVSYAELRRRNLVTVIGAGPANLLPPYTWGSHRSKLVEVLRKGCKGHEDLKLDPESFDRIVTWIDINAPYYAEYSSVYPSNPYGRSPLDGAQLGELSRLTGVKLEGQGSLNVSFTRPEMSPCLAKLDKNDPKYGRALAIIRAGKDMLARKPREDMPGSKLEGIDLERCRRYEALAQFEAETRKAILDGRRLYGNGKLTLGN
jgi:hypothetical protein